MLWLEGTVFPKADQCAAENPTLTWNYLSLEAEVCLLRYVCSLVCSFFVHVCVKPLNLSHRGKL